MNRLIWALPIWVHDLILRLIGYELVWNWDTTFDPREYFWMRIEKRV
jgi:hypothetical protein